MAKKYMTNAEVAQSWGISRQTFWRMLKAGTVPAPLVGDNGTELGYTESYLNEWDDKLKATAFKKMAA